MADETSPNIGLSVTTGNEISSKGKIIAGFLFIFFTLSAIVALIAYWPDRLPRGEGTVFYRNRPFNICLLDSSHPDFSKADSNRIDSIVHRLTEGSALNQDNGSDSAKEVKRLSDSSKISSALYSSQKAANKAGYNKVIPLNTLLLLLVALAGFMGTMIHITSSFTNYVGSEKFKKSWLLWYVVKPFTGAALALVLYFVFRAGLLNFNDTSNINLYGIITLAAFAGLFTDKATMKLAEIFEVIFRTVDPKTGNTNERPDSMKSDEVNLKITGIKPENLISNSDNKLVISGVGFDRKKLIIKIDEDEIQNPVIKGDSISLTYKIPDKSDKKEFMLRVYNEQGKEIYSNKLRKDEDNKE